MSGAGGKPVDAVADGAADVEPNGNDELVAGAAAAPNVNRPLLLAGVDEPKLRLGAAPKLNVVGVEVNGGIDGNVALVVGATAPKAKPPVDELNVPVVCVELVEGAPKANEGVLVVEPNVENDEAAVDGAPKLLDEPNAGAVLDVVTLPDEITCGAKGRGGLLAPKPKVVFADVVVVVDAPVG